jgi:hypothetical protein
MKWLGGFGAFALLAIISPALAQPIGAWRVNGAIAGRSFVLDCRFEEKGGTCTDASRGGKTHPLTSLSVAGNQARWTFATRVVLMSITLAFDGRIEGNRMSGTMSAAGRHGTFTAARS